MPNLKEPSDYRCTIYLADKKGFLIAILTMPMQNSVMFKCKDCGIRQIWNRFYLISVKQINIGKLFGQGTSLEWALIVPICPLECFQVWETRSQVV